jgi:hypothetical protein
VWRWILTRWQARHSWVQAVMSLDNPRHKNLDEIRRPFLPNRNMALLQHSYLQVNCLAKSERISTTQLILYRSCCLHILQDMLYIPRTSKFFYQFLNRNTSSNNGLQAQLQHWKLPHNMWFSNGEVYIRWVFLSRVIQRSLFL